MGLSTDVLIGSEIQRTGNGWTRLLSWVKNTFSCPFVFAAGMCIPVRFVTGPMELGGA